MKTKYNFLSQNYEKNILYSGINDYHHSHVGNPDYEDSNEWEDIDDDDEDDDDDDDEEESSCHTPFEFNAPILTSSKPYKIGVELEVEANSYDDFIQIKRELISNWIFMEEDCSLNSLGIECITVPLLPEDATSVDFWQDTIKYLTHHATSWKSPRTGLHIHIGREMFGSSREEQKMNISKLLYLYWYYIKDTDINTKINGRSKGYGETSGKCTDVDNLLKFGADILKYAKLRKSVADKLYSHNNSCRSDINILNGKTVEFRLGKGSESVNRIVSLITYYVLMSEFVKRSRWTSLNFGNFMSFIKAFTPEESPLYTYIKEYFK